MAEQRLIDAEALYKDMEKKLALKPGMEGTILDYMRFLALDCVETAPTVDAKPVVHAHWVWDKKNKCWNCSACEETDSNNYSCTSVDSPYCPNCGAQMDEKEQ